MDKQENNGFVKYKLEVGDVIYPMYNKAYMNSKGKFPRYGVKAKTENYGEQFVELTKKEFEQLDGKDLKDAKVVVRCQEGDRYKFNKLEIVTDNGAYSENVKDMMNDDELKAVSYCVENIKTAKVTNMNMTDEQLKKAVMEYFGLTEMQSVDVIKKARESVQ